jgi:hypothetical protein
LRAVWLDGIERQNYMHASLQATLYNAHFETGGVPFTAEDLLGKGDRQARVREKQRDKLALFKFTRMAQQSSMEDTIPEFVAELARNSKGPAN